MKNAIQSTRKTFDIDFLERPYGNNNLTSCSTRYACHIEPCLSFSTREIEKYYFAQWQPIVYDGLLISAAVEYCDRTYPRQKRHWGRNFRVKIPVLESQVWQRKDVYKQLVNALGTLTGDQWGFDFLPSKAKRAPSTDAMLALPSDVKAIMPFSDGLDSLAVATILENEFTDSLIKLRIGPEDSKKHLRKKASTAFSTIPFKVNSPNKHNPENSFRARGFKFLIACGLAAFLSKANQVILPESGIGSLGPSFVTVAHAHPDYRGHPVFTKQMELLFNLVLDTQIDIHVPQLWQTKGQTVRDAVSIEQRHNYHGTKSCWRTGRNVPGMNAAKKNCGVCAACLLRRLAFHSAGINDLPKSYIWEDLSVSDFDRTFSMYGVNPSVAHKQYAIAGVRHLSDLANYRQKNRIEMEYQSTLLASAFGEPKRLIIDQVEQLLAQHESEWNSFVKSLGAKSFVKKWADK